MLKIQNSLLWTWILIKILIKNVPYHISLWVIRSMAYKNDLEQILNFWEALLKPPFKIKTNFCWDFFKIFLHILKPQSKRSWKVHFHMTVSSPNMTLQKLRQILEKVLFLQFLNWKHTFSMIFFYFLKNRCPNQGLEVRAEQTPTLFGPSTLTMPPHLKLPKVTQSCPKLPKVTQSYPKIPKVTQSYQDLSKGTQSYPKLP